MLVIEQVTILLFFLIVGFVLSKLNVIKAEHSKLLSGLLVYVFLPCLVFKTFAMNLQVEYIKTKYTILVSSAILFLVLAIIIYFLAKLFSKKEYERWVYIYLLLLTNFGYFGFPLAENLYGEKVLMDLMVFTIPAMLFMYSVIQCKMTKTALAFKGILCQPVIIALLIGGIFGVFEIPLPDVVITILNQGNNCMIPIAMILTGVVLSEYDVKEFLLNKKMYFVSLLRLVLIPVAVVLVFKMLGLEGIGFIAFLKMDV